MSYIVKLTEKSLTDILGDTKTVRKIFQLEERTGFISSEVQAFVGLFNQLYTKNELALEYFRDRIDVFIKKALCIELGFNNIGRKARLGATCNHNNFYEMKIKTSKEYKKIGNDYWVRSLWRLIEYYIENIGLEKFPVVNEPLYELDGVEYNPDLGYNVCTFCNHPLEDCNCPECPFCEELYQDEACEHYISGSYGDSEYITEEMNFDNINYDDFTQTFWNDMSSADGHHWHEDYWSALITDYDNFLKELESEYDFLADRSRFSLSDDTQLDYLDIIYAALKKYEDLDGAYIYEAFETVYTFCEHKTKYNFNLPDDIKKELDDYLNQQVAINEYESDKRNNTLAGYIRSIKFIKCLFSDDNPYPH